MSEIITTIAKLSAFTFIITSMLAIGLIVLIVDHFKSQQAEQAPASEAA